MQKAKQTDYSSKRVQMFDKISREVKAKRIIKAISNHLGEENLKGLTVIDTGSSTGIIDNYLSRYFGSVYGIDIDKKAVIFAKNNFKRKNLFFQTASALKIPFRQNRFDVVICTHTYEHVSDASKLFNEIYRILKPGGICYLAAMNKYTLIEPHYNLPILSWLPKNAANQYVKLFGKAQEYYETPRSASELTTLTKIFSKIDLTPIILRNPNKFGFEDRIYGVMAIIAWLFSPISKYLAPTFFWILTKEQ